MADIRKPAFILFFFSGFCSLLYQVVWVRLAFKYFGIITPVLSVVVSVFMLGLAIGSWAGGRWIESWKNRSGVSAAYFYAASEGIIAMGAFLVPYAYALGNRLLAPLTTMNSLDYLTASAVVILISLIPWCVAMGTTFPFMMSFWREQPQATPDSFSWLYLANTLGAACGCLITAGVLIECLGFHKTMAIAGGLNFLIALGAVLLARRVPIPSMPSKPRSPVGEASSFGLSSKGALWTLFLTGLVSMSAEVVWTRSFVPVLSNTVYTFALILTVYLLAASAGSWMYRTQRGQDRPPRFAVVIAGLCSSALLPVIVNDPRLRANGLQHLLSLIPFCAILGYLTPCLIDDYSQGRPGKAGIAYAVNTLGCIAGPLITSYLILPHWGTRIGLTALALPLACVFLFYSKALAARELAACLMLNMTLFAGTALVASSYEEPRLSTAEVRRDYAATVISAGEGRNKQLLVNGFGMSSLATSTKIMAHLPLAFRPVKARSALLICFGMGTTYRSLLSWGIPTTAIELIPSVKDAFPYYHADASEILRNPQGRIIIDDGRRYLKRTPLQFDVVTIDPPPPIEAAGSSLLYSRDFYEEIKQHLSEGGVLQQWFPGGDTLTSLGVLRALKEAFRYLKIYRGIEGGGLHILASMQPLTPPTIDQFVSRMTPSARQDLLEWEKPAALRSVVKRFLEHPVPPEIFFTDPAAIAIDDDRPLNEYYVVRRIRERLTAN